ncbi:MAG: hypothetical protein ACKPEQ_12270, partial [Dolichospermum sp.]
MSLPAPPVKLSLPAPPVKLSLPAPPMAVNLAVKVLASRVKTEPSVRVGAASTRSLSVTQLKADGDLTLTINSAGATDRDLVL